MLGLLLRLRLTMWRRALQKTPRLVSTILGALAAVAGAILIGGILARLGDFSIGTAGLSVVLLTTISFLWTVFGISGLGADLSLDPRRFSLLPLRPGEVARGVIAAALLGVPAVFLVLLCAAQIVGWAGHGAAFAALAGSGLGVLTTVLTARIAIVALAQAMSSRRGRDVAALVMGLVAVLPMGVNFFFLGDGVDRNVLTRDWGAVATVFGWLPIGWGWSLPFDAAQGAYGTLAVHAALALVFLGGLWVYWLRLIRRELTSPPFVESVSRVRSESLVARVVGTHPAAVIALRRVRAWGRDNRLRGLAVRTLLVPVIMLVQIFIAPSGAMPAAIPLVLLAILGGVTLMNDLAFDGTAWWLHLTTGEQGAADRWGRVIATICVFAPLIAIVYLVVVIGGATSKPVALLAVLVAVFANALAVATVIGAAAPGTAPAPGSNPYSGQAGSGLTGCLAALAGMVVPLLLSLPVILMAHLFAPSGARVLGALALAVIQGAGTVWLAVWLAGRRLDAHGPEMLALLRRSVA